MIRSVLAVDLKEHPATIAAYQAHHRRVWPEVVESLRRAGIRQMEIYLLGCRLVMVVETDGIDFRDALAAHVASHPRVAEWESLMKAMQDPPPGSSDGDWWTEMQPIFRLEAAEHPPASIEPASRR